ncbi:hypothetical protein BCR42DRAFT_90488 [Absidia repens]|uniref:Uncharacterized protein n=1 Tax=Absidia repens TaxID=90262 RepID=A0A1X2IYP8_9FUNG|nr:hypothetical protein BCR42DRAFT_90488 [Absidia repens]
MRVVVFWQFSLYVVLLGVLHSTVRGWWCLVSVDASESKVATNKALSMSTSVDNVTSETPSGLKTATTTIGNNDDNLEEQLKDDQVALKRMVTILSLVGILGAVAVVATIAIFLKMRRRKQRSSNSANDRSIGYETPAQNNTSINNLPIESTTPSTDESRQQLRLPDTDTMEPQPSAPLSTFTATLYHHRRTLSIPLPHQSIPIPSAPSAKELNRHHQDDLESSSSALHQRDNTQGQDCYSEPPSSVNRAIAATPDLPPPAYTPSASPLYNGTYQSPIASDNVTQLTPSRRHSQF